jgi:hypothetical protein
MLELPLDFLSAVIHEAGPMLLPGPISGNAVALRTFSDIEQWRGFVLGLQLQGSPPDIVQHNYERMLRVLYLAWFDASIVKLAELAALANLEAAIKNRYSKKFKGLEASLRHLIEKGGVTDGALRSVHISGGAIVGNLLRKSKDGNGSSLSEIRNRLAHGDPFETMPWGGLFEVVRDLIDFMYPPPAGDPEIE